ALASPSLASPSAPSASPALALAPSAPSALAFLGAFSALSAPSALGFSSLAFSAAFSSAITSPFFSLVLGALFLHHRLNLERSDYFFLFAMVLRGPLRVRALVL